MKEAILIKIFLVLPLILFADYLIMAILGCVTCLFGMGDEFYCGPFCATGKILLALSAIGFMILLRDELKSISKNISNIFRKQTK